MSVRNKIEDELALGTKVLDVDFVALRTENPGTDYYKVSRVDSADTKSLSEKEVSEIARYKTTDLSEIVAGTRDDSGLAIEANSEVLEDIPDNI